METGAALELATPPADLTGDLATGLSIWGSPLTLYGNGNPTFGDAPLTVLANDNSWNGPISLNSNIDITFQGALADQSTYLLQTGDLTAAGATTLTGTNPTVASSITTTGSRRHRRDQ